MPSDVQLASNLLYHLVMASRLVAFVLVLFANLRSVQAQVARPLVQAEFSRVADTAHLEFKGLKTWRYELQKQGPKKFVLTVPPLETASLGKIQSFNDVLIDSVEVNQNGPDGAYEVTLIMKEPDVEAFDYLTDEPSRLIVDFYRKPEEKKSEVAKVDSAKKPPKAQAPATERKGKKGASTEGRKPAGDEILSVSGTDLAPEQLALRAGIFDAADDNYDRFRIKDYEIRDEAIRLARHNIYLPFPMLKMKVSQFDRLIEERPEFSIKPKDSRENKEARLLMTLFERNRLAVFVKTFEYFRAKYPESEYMEILKNLAAHVYLKRWRESGKGEDFNHAKALLSDLVKRYPDSPLREFNHMLLGFSELERGDALATLQTFSDFQQQFPQSPELPQVHKALAEAYIKLSKFEDARAEYDKVIKAYPNTPYAIEAFFRIGDVHFSKGDHTQAIKHYETALKEYPAAEKSYPNATFNMAEARFWQKDYKKSLNDFVNFVNLFPAHDFGGYSLTRVGELLGILGADQRRVMGAFLESYFRFGENPGAQVARMRMLSQQMRGMKPKELKKSLEEIGQIQKKLSLPGLPEFTTLLVSDGLTQRGDYEDAIQHLVGYYQENPLTVKQDLFRSRILRNIANQMNDQVDKGEFMKVLDLSAKYAKTWLKNNDRLDVPYFRAEAFENAGAYPEALRIYSKTLAHRLRLKGTPEEHERQIQEHLPSIDSLRLRIAAGLAQERKYIEAYQQLKELGAGSALSPRETIERVQLSAQIAEARNEPEKAMAALQQLAKHWQGEPALLAPVNLKLAQSFLKMGQSKDAESFADRVLATETGESKLEPGLVASAMTVRGDALLAQKKQMAAAEAYQKVLERFESSQGLGQVRYRLGQILFDRGDIKGASEIWRRLEGTPNDYLWKIAKERLADTQWRGDYNKYTNRIPAMANQEDKK